LDRSDDTKPAQEEQQDIAPTPPPPITPKRLKFAPRPPSTSSNTDTAAQNVQTAKETDLSLYLFELNSLPEETDALIYWLSRECQYANISKLALDLVSAPSSQAYVERVFFCMR